MLPGDQKLHDATPLEEKEDIGIKACPSKWYYWISMADYAPFHFPSQCVHSY